MSFDGHYDDSVLYAEPQPIYYSPAYTSDDTQWSSPALSDGQCPSSYLPGLYAKVPALTDSRRPDVPRVIQSEWSDVGPLNLPPYSQQPPAYIQSHYPDDRARFQYPEMQMMYNDPMPPPLTSSLDPAYDPTIKTESSVVVPTQSPYYSRPASVASMSSGQMPHHIVHVVFTDDAASKETQYLRRRCHNCQQVEPPSWRRSHLVPGKIVCNRCGLYERTHLRPRPHRFDEVRTGNKGRKPAKQSGSRQASPQPTVTQFTVKQESVPDVEFDSRRGSVASSFSSASSHSEWEDSNYTTSLVGAPLRLSPAHDTGAQRGMHYDASLAGRFRAGRKSATAPYDAFSAARMGPPTPPLVESSAFETTPPVRRHTLGTDAADIASWSTSEFMQPVAY